MSTRTAVLREVIDAAGGATMAELREWLEWEIRAEGKTLPASVSVGRLVLDRERRVVRIGDAEARLPPAQADALALLMMRPGHVVRLDALRIVTRRRTNGPELDESLPRVVVSQLRGALERIGLPRVVISVYGAGYVLCLPEVH